MTNEDIYAAVVALKAATEIGFQRIDERFDSLETRADRADMRLDGIDMQLGRVETHVLRLETRVEAVDDGLKDVQVRPASRFR